MNRRTYQANSSDATREWVVIDLDGKTLGRAASVIASVLRGKTKPSFTPHVDTGDFVVAINADKIALTGNKLTQKRYYRHSGYPGGVRSTTAAQMFVQHKADEMIRLAVRGMLPKNTLGRKLLKKLKVYEGATHPHAAQQPRVLAL